MADLVLVEIFGNYSEPDSVDEEEGEERSKVEGDKAS